MLYTVTWTIELDADTPRQAAERALTIQRDRTSTATIFDVVSEQGGHALVDLIHLRHVAIPGRSRAVAHLTPAT